MKDIDDIKMMNEKIEQKFIAIETAIATLSDVKELFEKILIRLEEEFAIPFVWISMVNRQHLPETIHDLTTSKILKYRLNIIDEGAFRSLLAHHSKPMLVNEDLKQFYRLLPLKKKFFIRSLAIVPISLHDDIIGSLNLGDSSRDRYQPDMDTTLLQRLASKISSRLSEIIPPLEKSAGSVAGGVCKNE